MKQIRFVIFIAYLFVMAACSPTQYVVEMTREETFQITDTSFIDLKSVAGDLTVLTRLESETPENEMPDEIQVSAQLIGSGSSEEEAQENLDALRLNFSQEEDTIFIVGSQALDTSRAGAGWISYTIIIPNNTSLNLNMERLDVSPIQAGGSGIWFVTLVAVVLFLAVLVLGFQLKDANAKVKKLSVEIRALRGALHMKKLEQEWAQEKQGQ